MSSPVGYQVSSSVAQEAWALQRILHQGKVDGLRRRHGHQVVHADDYYAERDTRRSAPQTFMQEGAGPSSDDRVDVQGPHVGADPLEEERDLDDVNDFHFAHLQPREVFVSLDKIGVLAETMQQLAATMGDDVPESVTAFIRKYSQGGEGHRNVVTQEGREGIVISAAETAALVALAKFLFDEGKVALPALLRFIKHHHGKTHAIPKPKLTWSKIQLVVLRILQYGLPLVVVGLMIWAILDPGGKARQVTAMIAAVLGMFTTKQRNSIQRFITDAEKEWLKDSSAQHGFGLGVTTMLPELPEETLQHTDEEIKTFRKAAAAIAWKEEDPWYVQLFACLPFNCSSAGDGSSRHCYQCFTDPCRGCASGCFKALCCCFSKKEDAAPEEESV